MNDDTLKLVKSKTLIDGTGRKPFEMACVLIKGDTIVDVGLEQNLDVTPQTEVIDLSNEYVLPGLIDSHTHLGMLFGETGAGEYPFLDQYRMLTATRHMREMLQSGVTTIRNVSENDFRAVACRHAVESELLLGPRMKIGTRGIRATHGWGQNAIGVDGADNLRGFIRENLEQGADLIKVFVTGEAFRDTALQYYFTDEEMFAIADEAHRAGKMVAAHAHGGPGLRQALEAGVDTVEHGIMISEEDIDLMVKKNTWLIPTFNPYLHDEMIRPERPPEFIRGVKKARANIHKIFPKALMNAVRFAVGTDARHGNYAFELECLIQLGVSPMIAIVAATKSGADVCGMADKIGTLEGGKLADMISVPKNPLEDVSHLREVHMVMKGGQRLDPITL